MKSNLDCWAIQYYPEELQTALNQIKTGTSIIYSNCTCDLKIGNQEISTRQFDTFLYNEESDVLIMLMRGGVAKKEDIIKYLEQNKKNYGEVIFSPSIVEYEDGDDIPEIWFAREKYVLEDALKDSIDKGVHTCEFYPALLGSLDLGYISNSSKKCEIDGRLFKGLIKLDDKIIFLINQFDNVDKKGNIRNLEYDDVIEIINKSSLSYNVIQDIEPDLHIPEYSKKIK